MRVLITGITGFVGSHLTEWLLARGGIELCGIEHGPGRTDHLDHVQNAVTIYDCDMRAPAAVHRVIAEARPDRIVHLAAQSFVPASWSAPADTLATNVLGQVHLLEAVRACGLAPRILIAGSSEEYGLVREDELPIKETNPLRPLSPYAVSKVAQDLLGFQYAQSYGMPIVRTRAFNHTGPRRGSVFASSNFAMQIALIEAGQQEPVIQVGNLEARRDFTDVRDIVRGYWLALEQGEPGEVYNLCSGRAVAIRDVLQLLLQLTSAAVTVQVDPRRLRPSDVPVLCGDGSKFQRLTGWRPEIPLRQTLEDLLNYWRAKISTEAPGASSPAGAAAGL